MAHVGAVQLAYPVVAESGPRANGLGACLVAQEAQSKLEAQPLAAVAIVRDAHGALPGVGAVEEPLGVKLPKNRSANLVKKYQIAARGASAVRYHRLREQESREEPLMLLRCEMEAGAEGEQSGLAASWLRTETFESLVELNEQCLELFAEQAEVRAAQTNLLLRQ